MVTSYFRPEVEIRPFHACAMHPAIITLTVRSLLTWLWGRYHVPQNVFLVFTSFHALDYYRRSYLSPCHSFAFHFRVQLTCSTNPSRQIACTLAAENHGPLTSFVVKHKSDSALIGDIPVSDTVTQLAAVELLMYTAHVCNTSVTTKLYRIGPTLRLTTTAKRTHADF